MGEIMNKDGSIVKSENLFTSLNSEEKTRLQELETIVSQDLPTFYEVGIALLEIRNNKLYRSTHKAFDAYCREKWNISKTNVNRCISAIKVIQFLTPMGVKNLPTNERQVRPLTGLPEAIQLEIWQQAVAASPIGNPTAKEVESLVKTYKQLEGEQTLSETEKLKLECQQLKARLQEKEKEHQIRAKAVADRIAELELENTRLKNELEQTKKDWDLRFNIVTNRLKAKIEKEYRDEINYLKSRNRLQETPGIYRLF